MRRHGYRYQRTIVRPAEIEGIGLLTGADIRLRFLPAPAGTGVVFLRSDLRHRPVVHAHVSQVTGTARRTTIGRGQAQVALVEHVLAALSALRIDNCCVELDGPEPPGLDGSSRGFVDALHRAGVVLQAARREIWSPTETVVARREGATLAIHPMSGDDLKISYILDYGPHSPIGWQMHTQVITPSNFTAELAACRTFLLEEEASELRRQGLGSRTTAADVLIFGPHGPIDNALRFANEPARHKCLDLVGDLALLGHDLRGHVVAYRSGHPLNIELAHSMYQRMQAGCRRSAAA